MTPTASILREWFGVGPAAGRLLGALFAADGAVLSFEKLVEACGQTRNGTNLSLKKLRAAMEPDSILASRHAGGYWMTEAGFADCRRALADAERRGVAA